MLGPGPNVSYFCLLELKLEGEQLGLGSNLNSFNH